MRDDFIYSSLPNALYFLKNFRLYISFRAGT